MNKAILKYVVTLKDDGKTVEKICKARLNISSKLFVFLKLNGKLTLNGEICKSIDIVKANDILKVDVTEEEPSLNIVPTNIPIEILYEDDFILVINKTRNMSVHPCMGDYENTLANAITYYWAQRGEKHKFHAVNRIDKDTSGVCVIAKNQFAHGVLSTQIKNKSFQRKYMAIVHGNISPDHGIIDMPIKRKKESVIKRIVAEDGKEAVTEYKTVKKGKKYSLVDIVLHTGRTHQIRVHFSHIGNPLLGDWLYGSGDEEREIAKGHLLHAYYVEFFHPATKEKMVFNLPLPDDMSRIDI